MRDIVCAHVGVCVCTRVGFFVREVIKNYFQEREREGESVSERESMCVCEREIDNESFYYFYRKPKSRILTIVGGITLCYRTHPSAFLSVCLKG